MERELEIICNENESRKTSDGRWRVWLNQKYAELARLHLHFWPRDRGKCGEHSATVIIMQEIHVLFIKLCVLSNII